MNPLAFGVLFGISVFGGISIEKFERDIRKDLERSFVGEHRSIVVRAKISLQTLGGVVPRVVVLAQNFSCQSLPFKVEKWRSHYGHVKHLELEMRHFQLKGLPVDSIVANIPDVRFDLGFALSKHHFRVVKSGTGPMTITLKLSDIQQFATHKFSQFTNLTIVSEGNRIVASGNASFAGLNVPFSVSGVPTVEGASKLVLSDPSVLVNGKPFDATKALAMFKGFSTLLDLNRDFGTGNGIHLASFAVKGDYLVGTGTAQFPENSETPSSSEIPFGPNPSPNFNEAPNSGNETPAELVSS